jgi:hypothetical protein
LTVVSDIDNEDNACSITKSNNEYSDDGMTIIKHQSDDSPSIIKHHSDDSSTIIKHHSDDSPTIIKHHSDDSSTIIKHHSDDSPTIIKHHSDDSPTIIKHHSDDSPTIIKHHSDDSPTIIKQSLTKNYSVTDDYSTFAVDYIQSIAAGNSPIAMQNTIDEYNEIFNDYDDTRYNVSNQIDHEKYRLADGMDDDSGRFDDVIMTCDIGNFQATINDDHVDMINDDHVDMNDAFADRRDGHVETYIDFNHIKLLNGNNDYVNIVNSKSNVTFVHRDIEKIFGDGNNNKISPGHRRFSLLSAISLLLIVFGYLAWHLSILNMHNIKSYVEHSLTRKDNNDDINDGDRYDLMKVTENVMIDVLLANGTDDIDVEYWNNAAAAADNDDDDDNGYTDDGDCDDDDSFITMIDKDVGNPNNPEYHLLITRLTDTDNSISISLGIKATAYVDDHSIELFGNTNTDNSNNNRILLFRLQIFRSITSMINKFKYFVRSLLLIRF